VVKINENFSVNPGNQSLRVLTLDEAKKKLPGCDFTQFNRYGGKKLKLYFVTRINKNLKGRNFKFCFSSDRSDSYDWREECFKEYWDSLPVEDAVKSCPPAEKKDKVVSKSIAKASSPKKKNGVNKFFKMYLLMTLLGEKKQ
jgi:hypothetical protein